VSQKVDQKYFLHNFAHIAVIFNKRRRECTGETSSTYVHLT